MRLSHRPHPGSQQVSAAVGSSLAAATDRLAYLEMVATLAKAVRTGRIEPSSLAPGVDV